MSKLVLIYPYFGHFPNYFNLFLNSARFNKDVDFCIITDNLKIIKKYKNFSSNIHFNYLLFSDLQKIVKEKFGSEVVVDRPYKLCDYKQFYCFIFSEYITGYEMWGFGDLDVIFGDINKFIFTKDCEIFYRAGHLQIFRNNSKVNNLVDKIPQEEKSRVFGTEKICFFDERLYSRFRLADDSYIKHHSYFDFADIYPYSPMLLRNYNGEDHFEVQSIYEFLDGKLYSLHLEDGKIIRDEILYAHFRKRFFICNHIKTNHFLALGTKFVVYKNERHILKILSKEKTRFSLPFRIYHKIYKILINLFY